MNTTQLIKEMKNVTASFLNYDNVEYKIIKNSKGKVIKLIEVEDY